MHRKPILEEERSISDQRVPVEGGDRERVHQSVEVLCQKSMPVISYIQRGVA